MGPCGKCVPCEQSHICSKYQLFNCHFLSKQELVKTDTSCIKPEAKVCKIKIKWSKSIQICNSHLYHHVHLEPRKYHHLHLDSGKYHHVRLTLENTSMSV